MAQNVSKLFENIGEVVGEALTQALGTEAVAAVGTDHILDLGTDITATQATTEAFTGTMINRITSTMIMKKDYNPPLPDVFYSTREFGLWQVRCYPQLQNIIAEYNFWNPWKDGTTPAGSPIPARKDLSALENSLYRANTAAKIFGDHTGDFTVPISIGTEQLKTAFTGWSAMEDFVSYIRGNVRLTIDAYMQALTYMHVAGAIAYASTYHTVHLLTEYNETAGTTLTWKKALKDKDFLRYALERMSGVMDNMRILTQGAFNNGEVPSFTNNEDHRTLLLTEFARSIQYYARPDTYHDDVIGIGEFRTLPMWQGISAGTDGDDFAFANASKIMIDASQSNQRDGNGIAAYLRENGGTNYDSQTGTFTLQNVVGLIYDKYAIAVTMDKVKTTGSYMAVSDTWQEFTSIGVNRVVDGNMNMVVFTLD